MTDPYNTLGVSPSASDEDVKKAYRDLARKYHPDNYANNPLADLAQEKMKEINEAYDTIQKQRESGSGSYYSSGTASQRQSYNQNYYAGSNSAQYNQIRNYINSGNIVQAENLLRGIQNHDAEWNFLMGSVCYRKGWMQDASRYFRTAASMQPSNAEYQNAVNMINQSARGYYNPGFQNSNMTTDDMCNCCSNALIADCCCEMMGGDCIPCI